MALRHAGGVVREIDREAVQTLLQEHDLPVDTHTSEAVWRLLRDRLVAVDAPPVVLRDDPQAIGRIEKAADDLLNAIRGVRSWGDINLSLHDFFAERGWHYDEQNLTRVLLVLKDAQARLFEPYNPTQGYHRTIFQLRDVIRDAGGNVAVHATSRFVRFLLAVEAARPALIFPVGTVNTERGRSRYIERALAEQASTNSDQKTQ